MRNLKYHIYLTPDERRTVINSLIDLRNEIKLIRDMRRRNPHAGLVVFWVKLRQRGYTRSITGLYRVLRKLGEPRKTLPNPKYIPKPYEKMLYPGQRVQIDVKFVPSACLVGEAKEEKFYQYTAIDEYSRFRYIEAFQEHNSYSSAVFLSICSRHFLSKWNVYKLTMAWSSLNV